MNESQYSWCSSQDPEAHNSTRNRAHRVHSFNNKQWSIRESKVTSCTLQINTGSCSSVMSVRGRPTLTPPEALLIASSSATYHTPAARPRPGDSPSASHTHGPGWCTCCCDTWSVCWSTAQRLAAFLKQTSTASVSQHVASLSFKRKGCERCCFAVLARQKNKVMSIYGAYTFTAFAANKW